MKQRLANGTALYVGGMRFAKFRGRSSCRRSIKLSRASIHRGFGLDAISATQ